MGDEWAPTIARRPSLTRTEPMPSDHGPTLFPMAKRPSRIDLLELDIDLRLTDLWREAARCPGLEPRRRRGLHAGGVRQGLLRRADGGVSGKPLRGARLPDPAAAQPAARPLELHSFRGPGLHFLCGPTLTEPCSARHRAVRRGDARDLPRLRRRWPAARRRSSRASCTDGRARSRSSARSWGRPRATRTGSGLRFRMRDVYGHGTSVPVVYRGSVPDLFKRRREVVVEGG